LQQPDGGPCRASTLSAGWIEPFVWDTLVAILHDRGLLDAKLEAHRTRVGAREVEFRSAAEQLRRELGELDRKQQRLLDLYLDDTGALTTPAVRARLEEFGRRRAALDERLAAAERQATAHHAQEAQQDAIRRFCTVALRGLARLTTEERQQLLRALVDEVVVRDGEIEIQGVLPGRWTPPRPARNRPQHAGVVGGGGAFAPPPPHARLYREVDS
jgi:hypothetical protein